MAPIQLDWQEPSQDTFLDQYWQRQPLLWRQALPGYTCPIDVGDLTELACEDEADARLIIHRPERKLPWTVRHGPFEPEDLEGLPGSGWTLLVQAVDAWLPQVAALTEAFDFLPSWRLDDIMVSHAVKGGGVGPHVDQYDVFLLQAAGHRRWRYGSRAGSRLAFRADLDLRILEKFEPTHEAILEPGDILYLPPGIAHEGIALDDDCLTFSIGFRAPSVADLAAGFADAVAEHAEELGDAVPRYGDAGLKRPVDPALIDGHAIDAMTELLRGALADPRLMGRMIGGLMTEPRLPPTPPGVSIGPAAVSARLVAGDALVRTIGSRWAHIALADGALLCVDGDCHRADADMASILSASRPIDLECLSRWQDDPALWDLLAELIGQGSLTWHDPAER